MNTEDANLTPIGTLLVDINQMFEDQFAIIRDEFVIVFAFYVNYEFCLIVILYILC